MWGPSIPLPIELVLHIAEYLKPQDLMTWIDVVDIHLASLLTQRHVRGNRNEHRETVVHLMVQQRRTDLIRLIPSETLLASPPKTHTGLTPLHQAANIGATEVAQLLLDKGHAVDGYAGNLWTALRCAYERRDLPMMRLLLGKSVV